MTGRADGDDWIQLQDGRTVRVRPVHDDDAEALIAMHERHSPRTVRRRFFSSMPHLAQAQARRFAEVDGTSRAALVAQDPAGALVAVARYDVLPPVQPGDPAAAEMAIVVTDEYQHHGLGVALLTRLVQVAKANGVDHFVADVLMENRPMLATFRDAGLTWTAEADGSVLHLELPLDEAEPVTPPASPDPAGADGPTDPADPAEPASELPR